MRLHPLAAIATAVTIATALAGCAAEGELATETHAIIGGVETDAYPEVVHVSVSGGCTGTLVGRRLVLTAAHCVDTGSGGVVRFGSGFGEFTDQNAIFFSLPHRFYSTGAVTRNDIAFVRLVTDAPASVTPLAVNLEPLTADDIGTLVRVVGFGHTDGPAQTGAGTKREVTLTIDELTREHIGFGSATQNICQGDSGGPTMNAAGTQVLAVSSFGATGCGGRSYVSRTDAHVEFVREVLSNWGDGPCALDGECGTDCAEFGDPDCDSCALDFVCAANCPRVDLDCPVGGLGGDLCGDEFACESRTCIEAADDPRIQYCSQACDETNPEAPACPVPLFCDAGMCRHGQPTPSAQGSTCDAGSDCRSGLCDTENRICAEPCGSDSDCDGYGGEVEFACEDVSGTKACTLATEGSCLGCGSTGSSSGGLLLFLLLFFGYGAAARRRRVSGERCHSAEHPLS